MSEKACRKCERLLEGGDLLRAVIIAKYVALKSKLHYALEKPDACIYVEHVSCSDRKGDYCDGISDEDSDEE